MKSPLLVDSHPASLQSLLLFNCLCFNPTLSFLGVTLYRTFSFSNHLSSLKAKLFSVTRPLIVSLLPHGAASKSPFIFVTKLLFCLFSSMVHPNGFHFLALLRLHFLEAYCLIKILRHLGFLISTEELLSWFFVTLVSFLVFAATDTTFP